VELVWETSEPRSTKARAERLIELLKTVDGMFLGRYLSFPEEVWTWHKYDMFTLQGISCLIGDEFLDGPLTQQALSAESAFSQLKRARKSFKMYSLQYKLKELVQLPPEKESWTHYFLRSSWDRASRLEGTRYTFVAGILSQTRGTGTPPPIVVLQSKIKFLETVTIAPVPFTRTARALISNSLDSVLDRLPQEAFTGLATKARVTVTTAASWENTRKTGGTAESIREILMGYGIESPVPVRDLDTGRITVLRAPDAFETVGEYIFWACLDTVLKTPLEDLKKVFLTVVKEPGKARSVTKGRACLKIVLDLVSKICAWPMKKGLRSSRSGMGQSHHGWNFFLRTMSEEMKEDLFHVIDREENTFGEYVERTDTFEDFFVSSTDFKEATDQMKHEFASLAGNAWM
jgi:hypothetical protein